MSLTPSWITKDLFEKAFRSYFKCENVEIGDFSFEPVVPAGDSYTSHLYRVNVCYELLHNRIYFVVIIIEELHFYRKNNGQSKGEKNISVLVKSQAIDGGVMDSLSREWSMFPSEITMFGAVLPKLHEILGETDRLSSECLLILKNPQNILVLEDLRLKGFKMCNRQLGLDLKHCLEFMKKIAKLHAASVILAQRDLRNFDGLKMGICFDSKSVIDWMRMSFETVMIQAKKWPGYEKYGNKLEKLGEKLVILSLKASKHNKNDFNVLNHGDCWSNNIMFSYFDGEITDIKFVDFQLSTYKSPVIDLHYFLATSPNLQVRSNHLNIMLDTYHETLIAQLTKLEYNLEKVPNRKEFQRIFEERAFYGLMSAVTVLPLVRADSRKDATFDDLMNDNSPTSFRQHIYSNSRFRGMMEYQLKYFDDLGIFDLRFLKLGVGKYFFII